jgi:uncharacterized sulfatase
MKQPFFEKIIKATQSFAVLSLLWLLFIILLSIYEILFNGITHEFTSDTGVIMGANIVHAVVFWVKCNLWFYLLFTIFYHYCPTKI